MQFDDPSQCYPSYEGITVAPPANGLKDYGRWQLNVWASHAEPTRLPDDVESPQAWEARVRHVPEPPPEADEPTNAPTRGYYLRGEPQTLAAMMRQRQAAAAADRQRREEKTIAFFANEGANLHARVLFGKWLSHQYQGEPVNVRAALCAPAHGRKSYAQWLLEEMKAGRAADSVPNDVEPYTMWFERVRGLPASAAPYRGNRDRGTRAALLGALYPKPEIKPRRGGASLLLCAVQKFFQQLIP